MRLTPNLHELMRQVADAEDRGLGDFVRDAVIYRLGTLGLVPVVGDDQEHDDDE